MPRIDVPWWAKIAAKLVLSRLPVQYETFARLGAFRHGAMVDPRYALNVLRSHLKRVDLARLDGMTCLELGPGDSVTSALVAYGFGAQSTYLVDAGSFARQEGYAEQLKSLREEGIDVPEVDSLASVLEATNSHYLTEGYAGLRSIESNSVDFVWSQAVLEHVRVDEFDASLVELHRVLKIDGVASHTVDLKDHLGGSLNNLRFSTKFWERDWWANSGFYTNRIRFSDMLARFEAAGFEVKIESVDRYETLPLKRRALAYEFRECADEELLVRGFNVLLRPTKVG